MPWELEDVLQFLSVNGDSDPVYLWRDRELHRQPDEPQEAPNHSGELSAGTVQRRRVVFFSCRVGTAIDTDRESQELKGIFHRCRIQYDHEPRPEMQHFTDKLMCMESHGDDVSFIFSGHGDGDCAVSEFSANM